MKILLRILYYVFLAFIALIAILLIISVFPITGNIKFMTVQSGSMSPAVKMGSVVMVKPIDDYKIGDVITFGQITKTKSPTTHRIYDIKVVDNTPVYITKGDANNGPDQREVSTREIIGKVLVSVPYAGFAVDAVRKPIGFMLIIIIPAALIIFDEARKIYNELRIKKLKKNV